MIPKFRHFLFVLLSLTLMGCSLPRGAALQSEIIKVKDDETAEFAVYPVTKELLPRINKWPRTGNVRRYSWLGKRQGPSGRVILPGDSIAMSVWDSDPNSLLTSGGQKVAQIQPSRVSTNGEIFLPYVGTLKVSGLSEARAREKVQDAFMAVSPSAQVQLSAEAGSRHSVDLVSGVNSPGSYPLEERNMTVMKALSLGGGARDGFENPQIRVLRGNTTYAIALDKLLKTPALDTTLRSGDKIVVAEDESYFLALGATGTEELITFPDDHVTALDAVALMGGVSDSRADIKGVLILREYSAKAVRADSIKGPSDRRAIFTLDLASADGLFSAGQFHINPKDVVYATESPVNNVRTVLSLVGSIFGVATAASSATSN